MKRSLNLLLIVFLFLASCHTPKEYIYFEKRTPDSLLLNAKRPIYEQPRLAVDDEITLYLSAVDPDVIKPFLLLDNATGNKSNTSNYALNANGEIELPVIGSIKLAGLTVIEATNLLKSRLSKYVNSPIVDLRLNNMNVTVLGDVKSPGVFSVKNGRVTLLEALGLAGDMNYSGQRKNVLVIREEEGVKKEIRVNMNTDSLFVSDVYFLKKNDVVYVEPGKQIFNRDNQSRTYLSSALIATSIILNVFTIFSKK
ncbi:MAG: polysaccharide biosynthesis/export family protein [Chitinophagaceae bacterium]